MAIVEIELKLELDPAHSDKLRRHPLIAQLADGKPEQDELTAIYFDTPEFALYEHGAGLRVRKTRGRWIQTLKAGGNVKGGLHQRDEWEMPVGRAVPELDRLASLVDADSSLSTLLKQPSLAGALQPIFRVKVQRTTWNLRDGDSCIELVLDEGSVQRDDRKVPVSEIELELKEGEPGRLYAIAQKLLDGVPLRLSNVSKAQRGYALCRQEERAPVKAAPVAFPPSPTIEDGMQAIVLNCLAQIQANEVAVMESGIPECLHQMRVGLRRLRSALKLFEAAATCPADLQEELRWLGEALGEARDWDVLSSSTLARAAGAGDASFPALNAAVDEVVRGKRDQAGAALRSPRYARLMIGMFAWAIGQQWRNTPALAHIDQLGASLKAFAGNAVKQGHKRILKRGRNLRCAPPEELHRLRIAGKRNRYAVEFFAPLFRPKRLRKYLDALSAVQDELGWRNDVSVGDLLLRHLETENPAAAASAAYARGFLAAHVSGNERALRKTWKRFHKTDLPRLR